MGPELFQTPMGRKFYERDVPEIASALTRIADALEKQQPPPVVAPWRIATRSGDTLIFERAEGYFTQEEVDLLSARLLNVGARVEEAWNGAGAPIATFRTMRSFSRTPLRDAEEAFLCAPRASDALVARLADLLGRAISENEADGTDHGPTCDNCGTRYDDSSAMCWMNEARALLKEIAP
jgi:hypothetical protein